MYAAPAGGGGWVLPQELEKTETANFSATPESGYSPLTVVFKNLTITPSDDTFYWDLGSGSLTSTSIDPPNVTYTETGSYTVTLQETSSQGNRSEKSVVITVNVPVVSALFSVNPTNSIAPFSASITDLSTVNINSVNDTYAYNWYFGDGTTSVYRGSINHTYSASKYVVQLQITESYYGLTSVYTLPGGITGSAPTLAPSFTFTTSSNTAPFTVSFTNTSTQQVGIYDSFNYTWDFGDGSPLDTVTNPTHIYQTGSWTASLSMTESFYNITSKSLGAYISASS